MSGPEGFKVSDRFRAAVEPMLDIDPPADVEPKRCFRLSVGAGKDVGSLLNFGPTFIPKSDSFTVDAAYAIEHHDNQSLTVGATYINSTQRSSNEAAPIDVTSHTAGISWGASNFAPQWEPAPVSIGFYTMNHRYLGWVMSKASSTEPGVDATKTFHGIATGSSTGAGVGVHWGARGAHSLSLGVTFGTHSRWHSQSDDDKAAFAIPATTAELSGQIVYSYSPWTGVKKSSLVPSLNDKIYTALDQLHGFLGSEFQASTLTGPAAQGTDFLEAVDPDSEPNLRNDIHDTAFFPAVLTITDSASAALIGRHSQLANTSEDKFFRVFYPSTSAIISAKQFITGDYAAGFVSLDNFVDMMMREMFDLSPQGTMLAKAGKNIVWLLGAGLVTDEKLQEGMVQAFVNGHNTLHSLPSLSASTLIDGKHSFHYAPWGLYSHNGADSISRGHLAWHKYLDTDLPSVLTLSVDAKQLSGDSIVSRIKDEKLPDVKTPITIGLGMGLSKAWLLGDDVFLRASASAHAVLWFRGATGDVGVGGSAELGLEYAVSDNWHISAGMRGSYTKVFVNGDETSFHPFIGVGKTFDLE